MPRPRTARPPPAARPAPPGSGRRPPAPRRPAAAPPRGPAAPSRSRPGAAAAPSGPRPPAAEARRAPSCPAPRRSRPAGRSGLPAPERRARGRPPGRRPAGPRAIASAGTSDHLSNLGADLSPTREIVSWGSPSRQVRGLVTPPGRPAGSPRPSRGRTVAVRRASPGLSLPRPTVRPVPLSPASRAGAAVFDPPGYVQATIEELGTPLSAVTFVVVDLETTGGSPNDSAITEIGA